MVCVGGIVEGSMNEVAANEKRLFMCMQRGVLDSSRIFSVNWLQSWRSVTVYYIEKR